jgi:glycosyltransferase involved in cell wall biosynthesis
MNILVICQYYYPEPFRINDVCEELVRRGHNVTVVTGEPNYPDGQIYKGYENHNRSDEVINGVIVHRCPIIPRKTGALYRILNYFSYPIKAKKYIKNLMANERNNFDVLFINQLSPVMMAEPGIYYKKKNNVPVVMYCLDLWPESLVAGGISRSSIIYKIFHMISKNIYRKMDRVLITSRLFREYLVKEFDINEKRIEYLPQYAEDLFNSLPYKNIETVINLVFAGNIGEIQSVDTIIRAASKLKAEPIHFHIVGSGTDLERIKKLSEGLNNVTFHGRHPVEDMPSFYEIADAMLVTLKADPILSLTLPGKVQSYMAVGKPIIGAINGETVEVINAAKCGYCGKAEDVDALVENIHRFVNSNEKQQMGENAKKFYNTYFSKDKFMDKLEAELKNSL